MEPPARRRAPAHRAHRVHVAGTGAVLRYHGDLDRGGLSIAASVIALSAQPWRLGVDDYRRAVCSAGRPLRGNPTATPWDPDLFAEVERTGLGVDEEAVLQELLDDLAHHVLSTCPTPR
ncbi:DUF2399 domain-containing protein [Kineococcus sp. SYSU DK018]|uniref:DUF2399 domain-containing protein n=1 Tax=Kineococcus sp. SYSU DK018 TaxID=3383139 RepID=UPI003D7E22E8